MRRIALGIHFWGGNSGFRSSISGKGYLLEENFNEVLYKRLLHSIFLFESQDLRSIAPIVALAKECHGLGVSFGSKHFSFWTNYKQFEDLPIYDDVIAKGAFRETAAKWEDYIAYVEWVYQKAEEYNLTVRQVERLLYNYLNFRQTVL